MKNEVVNWALRMRIAEKFGTQCSFAKAAGCTNATVSRVLRGQHTPKKVNFATWCSLLDIAEEEKYIFFTQNLQKTEEYPIPTESDST